MTRLGALYREGQLARRGGVGRKSNPYVGDEHPRPYCRAWDDGWLDEDQDLRDRWRDEPDEEAFL